ncbi:hypothetical protein PSHT_15472 [Puccinia striiformis]|uniref:Uncharacterized protein n=2 Tax=Puccinia striiformis TaxID=27350 RepID=A0A2S4UF50_9BASI|nr:hypothetical protein PSTT_16154 [Puccinia striiformis]POV95821.1 hypothetical protein PSHT_15472 [Puccinia striiformis]
MRSDCAQENQDQPVQRTTRSARPTTKKYHQDPGFRTSLTMPHKRAKASIRKAESERKGFDLPPNQQANKKRKRKEKHNSSRVKTYEISEDIPKNMFMILNAEKIRADYKIRKAQNNDPLNASKSSSSSMQNQRSKLAPTTGSNSAVSTTTTQRRNQSTRSTKAQDELKILPGEGLGSFNRRVEATLRPKVTAVMKAAKNKLAPKKADTPGVASSSTPAEGPKAPEVEEDSIEEETPNLKAKPVKDFAPRPSKFPITDVAMEPPTLSLTKTMKKNLASSNRTPFPISSAQKRSLELEREKVINRYRQMKEERYAQQQQ